MERYWNRVDKSGDCWIWKGGSFGPYGAFWLDGKNRKAHRVSAYWYGIIDHLDDPRDVDHKPTCDKRCVNPDHLQALSRRDHTMLGNKRGENPPPVKCGEENGNSKLTREQVEEIRAKYIPRKYSTRKLAKEYGVSSPLISAIVRREIWNT